MPRKRAVHSANSRRKPGRFAQYDHPVDRYARRVLGDVSAGEPIIAGPLVRLACERHLRDRQRTAMGESPWRFDEKRADLVLQFFPDVLRLPDVIGVDGQPKPFALEPSQVFIIGSLMGWVDTDGYRRFREAYIEEGKGNGKSPMLAALGLYGLTLDGEQAPEIYAAATTRDQAQILFRDAVRMVQASALDEALTISGIESPHNISNRENLGFFRPFSREQGIKSGPRPSMALVDEVHEHPTGEIINKLKAGFKSRKQPLLACITNSGFDRESICYQMHAHAEAVMTRALEDDQFFAYVCALDEGDDPLIDEACWIKTNPLLGISVTRAYLTRQVENAKNLPAEQNTVLRLNFCVWTEQDERWIDMETWRACGGAFERSELRGQRCYGGLDLASTQDVSAFVLVFPDDDEGCLVLPFFWVPSDALQRRVNHDRVPYDQWVADGVLATTPGRTCDYDRIREDIRALSEEFAIEEIAYDRWGATQLVTQLEADGANMAPLGQGFASLSAPMKELEKLIVSQRLRHGGHPVLQWMAGNVAVEHDAAGNIKPSKRRSREKIDGIVALVMAVDRMARYLNEPSVYDADGAEIFVV